MQGGHARLLEGRLLTRRDLVRSNVCRPVVPGGLALSLDRLPPTTDLPPGGECWSLRLDPTAVYPDGAPVRAEEIVRNWEAALQRDGSPADWLLRHLAGRAAVETGRTSHVSGLRPAGRELTLCFDLPTPDLVDRLAHPALCHSRARPPADRDGPGPYQLRADELWPNLAFPGPGPYLERLVLVRDAGNDPALLLRLGEADVAVVGGRTAGSLLERRGESIRLEPLSNWDSVYFVWLDPSHRWSSDPTFRRWLAGAIDRRSMLGALFDDRGDIAYSLSGADHAGPLWEPVSRPPFSPAGSPRLVIAHDRDDPRAAEIAARLRVALELQGLDLTVRARAGDALLQRGTRETLMILGVHRPPVDDPVLALLDTLWPLGGETDPAIARLEHASRLTSRHSRLDAARQTERALLSEARIVPLVRLHEWLAISPFLDGVSPGPPGLLDFRAAWWNR